MVGKKCITKHIHYLFISMTEETSNNENTLIGGTMCGSSTAPTLESLINGTFLGEASLTINEK